MDFCLYATNYITWLYSLMYVDARRYFEARVIFVPHDATVKLTTVIAAAILSVRSPVCHVKTAKLFITIFPTRHLAAMPFRLTSYDHAWREGSMFKNLKQRFFDIWLIIYMVTI